MTKDGAHTAILTSGLLVAGTYAIRKLIEPAASEAHTPAKSLKAGVLQVAGAEPAPAPIGQWATGYGFTFVSLSIIGTFAPAVAGSMAVLIAATNTIINGGAIFTDITQQVEGGEAKEKSRATGSIGHGQHMQPAAKH